MRQYATGKKFPSEERAKKIESVINEIGKDLLSVKISTKKTKKIPVNRKKAVIPGKGYYKLDTIGIIGNQKKKSAASKKYVWSYENARKTIPGGEHFAFGSRPSEVVATTIQTAPDSLLSLGLFISTRPGTGCSAKFRNLNMISAARHGV